MTASHPDSAYLAALDDIAEGALIAPTCQRHGITRKGLREWSLRSESNRAAYARARTDSAASLEDEIMALCDDVTPDNYQALNVVIQTKKWAAAKRHPREYGDKVVQERTGDTTVTVRVVRDGQPVDAQRLSASATLALPDTTSDSD